MNLFGNSLKFTSVSLFRPALLKSLRQQQDGYVHVMLRQLPLGDNDPPNKVKIELSVNDSGKVCSIIAILVIFAKGYRIHQGISQNFLKVRAIARCDTIRRLIHCYLESAFPSILTRKSFTNRHRFGPCHCQQHRNV